MKNILNKTIIILLILIILLTSWPVILITLNANEMPNEYYNTVEDYLKVYYEGYENLEKDEITSIFLDSLDRCFINDFSGLYDYPNLTELSIWGGSTNFSENPIDLSKIDKLSSLTMSMMSINNKWGIENLTNLKELSLGYVYMEEGESLNLDLSKFSKLSSLHIAELDGDLSNVKIDLRQISENLSFVQIGLSIQEIQSFSLKNIILVKDNKYYFTNIKGNEVEYFWSSLAMRWSICYYL